MKRIITFVLCLIVPATLAMAAGKVKDENVKELSGMSIIGNDEAPKSLYIVPWKSSEIGIATSLSRLNDIGDAPVDQDVFIRQLDFYETSTAHQNGRN